MKTKSSRLSVFTTKERLVSILRMLKQNSRNTIPSNKITVFGMGLCRKVVVSFLPSLIENWPVIGLKKCQLLMLELGCAGRGTIFDAP